MVSKTAMSGLMYSAGTGVASTLGCMPMLVQLTRSFASRWASSSKPGGFALELQRHQFFRSLDGAVVDRDLCAGVGQAYDNRPGDPARPDDGDRHVRQVLPLDAHALR